MTGDRIEAATRRIESALIRIARVADGVPAGSPSVAKLADRHERLRETVAGELRKLDDLITRMEE